jgi:hypothetical protein
MRISDNVTLTLAGEVIDAGGGAIRALMDAHQDPGAAIVALDGHAKQLEALAERVRELRAAVQLLRWDPADERVRKYVEQGILTDA